MSSAMPLSITTIYSKRRSAVFIDPLAGSSQSASTQTFMRTHQNIDVTDGQYCQLCNHMLRAVHSH